MQEQDKKPVVARKNPPSRTLGMVIKVKPQAKKAKVETADLGETAIGIGSSVKETSQSDKVSEVDVSSSVTSNTGLVSYSDESEEDDY